MKDNVTHCLLCRALKWERFYQSMSTCTSSLPPPPSRLCQVGRRWLVWTAATHKAYPVHISIAKDEEWRFISHVSAKLHYYEILYCKHTHSFSGPFSGTTRVSLYQKGKSIWILLKQETMSGSGISWATCKPASRFRPITLLAPHHSVFYRPDALPAAQPTESKHWRQCTEGTT